MYKIFFITLFAIIAFNCTPNKSWYNTGHFESDTVFVVNDSIKIIATTPKNKIRYEVFCNDEQCIYRGPTVAYVDVTYTYQKLYNSQKELINCLESRYNDYLRYKKPKEPNYFFKN